MDRITKQLAGHSIIGLDTSIFIYHFEAHPDYLPLTTEILNGVQSGKWQAVTSTITLMELTVHPWRNKQGNVARTYEALLANFPNLRLIDVSRDIARRAAQLRAKYNLRTPDALQIGTALINGATTWVSNDKKHERIGDIVDTLILKNFL